MTKLLAAALLTVSSVASAQTFVATDVPPEKPLPRAVDARLGMLVGSAAAGDVDGISTGLSGGIGYRIGDLTMRGLADVYSVGDNSSEPMHRHGRADAIRRRSALLVRATPVRDATLIADFWGEAGGGFEHIAWLHGGVLDRPRCRARVRRRPRPPRRSRARPRTRSATSWTFRTFVGEAPAVPGEMATCSGPCTSATTPPRADLTMFFELGVHWGR